MQLSLFDVLLSTPNKNGVFTDCESINLDKKGIRAEINYAEIRLGEWIASSSVYLYTQGYGRPLTDGPTSQTKDEAINKALNRVKKYIDRTKDITANEFRVVDSWINNIKDRLHEHQTT